MMIVDLKPYRAMKDSGVPWLGEVPEHWDAPRLKTLFREVDRRSGTGEEPLLSLRMQQGLVDHHVTGGTPIPPSSLIHYKRTQPDDIVMNRMRAAAGLFAVTPTVGLVSPDYAVLRPRTLVDVQYFVYLFRTPLMMSVFRLESRGLGTGESGFLRLYTERFGMLAAPVPPHGEQSAIVRFLNHADRLIRRYISAKQKLIKLLEEQRQAIMHRAVTRGLDPNVRLKPSGVEWLEEVPEHWEVMLNQRILKEKIRPHGGRPETQLSLSQRDGLIATSDMQERSMQTSSYDSWKLAIPGDLVVNRFKAHLGVFFASSLRGIVSFHYGVFAPRRKLVTKYFELLYHTNSYKTIFAGRSNGMTVGLQNLSNQNFYSVRSIVPPCDEQLAIVAFAETATQRLTKTIEASRREIALLREYSTRLIADVVTGKLDVRDAAVGLPDETDQSDEFGEADSVLDDEPEEDADAETVANEAEG